MRIGILEDEAIQAAIYKLLFSTDQYQHKIFGTVSAFLDALKHEHFDLLLIDWILPDGTAEDALKWIRENLGWDIPVICVTSCEDESDVVNVLNLGADDYFIKSAKYFELLARVQSLARRSQVGRPAVLHFGPYEIHQENQEIIIAGKTVDLTQKEFELASFLFKHPNRLLSRMHILENIWGTIAEVDTRTVDTHISRIRRKLELPSPQYGWDIITIYGYGYRLVNTTAANPTN